MPYTPVDHAKLHGMRLRKETQRIYIEKMNPDFEAIKLNKHLVILKELGLEDIHMDDIWTHLTYHKINEAEKKFPEVSKMQQARKRKRIQKAKNLGVPEWYIE